MEDEENLNDDNFDTKDWLYILVQVVLLVVLVEQMG